MRGQQPCRETKMQTKTMSPSPTLQQSATHISKLMVPEVGLVTLEQLYCEVTVLSIAFLQKKEHRCATVLNWPDLLPEKVQPDQMLLEQKQEEESDESLMRAPAIPSSPHPCVIFLQLSQGVPFNSSPCSRYILCQCI